MMKRTVMGWEAGYQQVALFVAMLTVVFTAIMPSPALAAVWTSKPHFHRHGAQGHPNIYHPSQIPAHHGPYPGPKPVIFPPEPLTGKPSLTHPFKPSMHELVVPLTHQVAIKAGTKPTYQAVSAHAISSDGQIEVNVPANALTQSEISGAGGTVNLVIDQIDGPSGSTGDAGGSGILSFGSYEFQLQDASRHEITLGTGTHPPFTFVYHWLSNNAPIPFQIDPPVLMLNGSHRVDLPHPMLHPGKSQALAMRFDAHAKTFTSILPLSSSGTGSIGATAPSAYFGAAQNFQTDMHTGGLNDSIPIAVPTGPGGLTPSLHLDYSSDAVSATHNPQAVASWVGMGWSLDPGEITWSQSDIMANTGASQWENSWNLVDANGNSSSLIPPSTTVSTYYDMTGNSFTSQPLVWHTSPESHAKIISFTNPNKDCTNFPQQSLCGSGTYPVQPPCWRMWLPNGDMEEFGCTLDSRQFYPTGTDGTHNNVNAWKLDMITDPSGNQIHYTYLWDNSHNQYNINYPRDVVLSSITWDDPTCHDANTMCSTWNPQMQVSFSYGHTVGHPSTFDTVCGANGSLRCDDPVAETSPNIGTPVVLETEVLNDVTVNVRQCAYTVPPISCSSYTKLRNYQFSYGLHALNPNAIADPFTGYTESVAGYLLLEQVAETGTDGTAYPVQTFKYTIPDSEWYEDSNRTPQGTSGQGPAWNTGNRPGHNCTASQPCAVLWSRTYAGFYMSEADNNEGLQQTFSWEDMRTNQHGVDTSAPAPDNNAGHAYACTDIQSAKTYNWNMYPCDLADDNGWSHISLTSRTVVENAPNSGNSSYQLTSTWTYNYNLANLSAHECSDCNVGMYWGNANDGDYLDFYNGKFTGFFFAQVVRPDNSLENDYFYDTEGWGLWTTNTATIPCEDGYQCQLSASWDLINAASGMPYEVDQFDVKQNGTYNLLKRETTTYTLTCPPSGVSGSPARNISYWGGSHNYTWSGNLVGALDLDNPITDCDVQPTQVQTYLADGTASPNTSTNPMVQTAMQYNSYGQLTQTTTTGDDLGSTPTIVTKLGYIYNDNITTSATSASGTYMVNRVATSDTEDGAGNIKGCIFTHYDGSTTTPVPSGQQSSLTRGLVTQVDKYATTCTSSGGSGLISTQSHYDQWGNPINTTDADANAGINGHTASTGNCSGYTTCTFFDTTFDALPTSQINALNQTATINYTASQAFGYGLWPSSTTDLNGQMTSVTYDGLGRTLTTNLPGEGNGLTTKQMAYSPISSCPTTGPSEPCLEVDDIQRLDSGHTITTRNFYDGWGHLVETRRPASYGSSKDVVQFTMYDTMGRVSFKSNPYFVTAYTGSQMGTAAYSVPLAQSSAAGTTYTYDGLGRVIKVFDPDSFETDTAYSPVCVNSVCYERIKVTDPDFLQHDTYSDALNRVISSHDLDGGSNLLRTLSYSYDYLGRQISTTYADGTHTSTTTYDLVGRKTAVNDPDLGNWTYGYDPNGNVTSTVDPRGTGGTVYLGYDGVDRHVWTATSSNGSNPLASYTYDQGTNGIGRLSQEQFASGPSQSVTGSYVYTYDTRGRTTQKGITIAGAGKTYQLSYNDADQPLTLTYSDGTLLTSTYDTQDWLTNISLNQNGTNTSLLDTLNYSGFAGPFGMPTSAQFGADTTTWQANYDADLRQTFLSAQQLTSPNTTWYSESLQYDASGNTINRYIQVPAGIDDENYCNDSLYHLIWAGSQGTEPTACGGGTITDTTVGGYSQSAAFDTLDRMTSGLSGTYTYGDNTHLNAVTSTSSGYTASYDAAGEMTCRAPTSSTTCSGSTPNGQQLSYDALDRLTSWISGSNSAYDAYNGEGQRVWQQTTNGGTTTTTTYYGGWEEVSSNGTTTTTTKYFAAGPITAVAVNGTLSYLVHNTLGSISLALSNSGSLEGITLDGPWGQSIYTTGSMPTAKGFIGQYGDVVTGLDYFNARYYDPAVGQFTQADLVQGPNRYTYVNGNPETLADPSGADPWWQDEGNGGTGSTGGNTPPPGPTPSAVPTPTNEGSANPNGSNPVQDAIDSGAGPLENTLDSFLGISYMKELWHNVFGTNESVGDKIVDGGTFISVAGTDILLLAIPLDIFDVPLKIMMMDDEGEVSTETSGARMFASTGGICGNSFVGNTLVSTSQGSIPINSIKIGSQVLAYNPKTGKTKSEPVEHVFINHDANLLDVTLRTEHVAKQRHNNQMETLHTTSEHPFLTVDRGFVKAIQLLPGEKVRGSDGSIGIVLKILVVAGIDIRYNLTVAHEHTFIVGVNHWIVHNVDCVPSGLTATGIKTNISNAQQLAANAGSNQGSRAAYALAYDWGTNNLLGGAPNGPETDQGLFIPGVSKEDGGFSFNSPGTGRCAEFYCANAVGVQKGKPIDLYVYQRSGFGPCEACASTIQQWANENEAPIRAIWLNQKGDITYHVWNPMP